MKSRCSAFLVVFLTVSSLVAHDEKWPSTARGGPSSAPAGDVKGQQSLINDIRRTLAENHLASSLKHIEILPTSDGGVMLQGTVSSFEEKTKIAFVAAKLAGVGKVDDHLEISSGR